jgi:hypothetical protein
MERSVLQTANSLKKVLQHQGPELLTLDVTVYKPCIIFYWAKQSILKLKTRPLHFAVKTTLCMNKKLEYFYLTSLYVRPLKPNPIIVSKAVLHSKWRILA